MPEIRRRLHICDFLLSPITSCKSKHHLNDVVDTHRRSRSLHFYRLADPSPSESPENSAGWKCPPSTPAISPFRPFSRIPTKKKTKKLGDGEEDERAVLISWGPSRLPRDAYTRRRRSRTAAEYRGSVAVVKRSTDPYGDFRRSMVEMIVEKEIFDGADLKDLLQCFLDINSSHHHKVIVQVFREIWEVLKNM